MVLRFLGTGAPEGNPSPFCDCEHCEYVRENKGRNIRLQASLLVNNDLLIDFGPDVTRAFNAHGISMSHLKYVLVTHCHFDHFYGGNIYHRLVGPRTQNLNSLHIYGPARMQEILVDWLVKPHEQKVVTHVLEPYRNAVIGPYKVKTFATTPNDAFSGHGMCYAISQGETTILYAVDTYEFPETNWKAMRGLEFNLVILDETFGYKDPPNKDHHNIPLFLKTIQRFNDEGLTHSRTRFYTQHMSHHNPPHDELSHILAKHLVIVPYDGMEIVC